MSALTKPQMELLQDLERSIDGERTISESYRPAQRLVELGLARWVSHSMSEWLRITNAGLDRLAALSQPNPHKE